MVACLVLLPYHQEVNRLVLDDIIVDSVRRYPPPRER
jgi:hypothetical protein